MKFQWLLKLDGIDEPFLSDLKGYPSNLPPGLRVVGLNVGQMRALLAAGEERDRKRAALNRPAAECGISGIVVKDSDLTPAEGRAK